MTKSAPRFVNKLLPKVRLKLLDGFWTTLNKPNKTGHGLEIKGENKFLIARKYKFDYLNNLSSSSTELYLSRRLGQLYFLNKFGKGNKLRAVMGIDSKVSKEYEEREVRRVIF